MLLYVLLVVEFDLYALDQSEIDISDIWVLAPIDEKEYLLIDLVMIDYSIHLSTRINNEFERHAA